jgi:hypothetical protein
LTDFFDQLDERAADPFNLREVPTQALLDEFLQRAERGETVAPIVHWIGCMAGLSLIKEYVLAPEAMQLSWLLDTLVKALVGNGPEYHAWVAEVEATGMIWDVGVPPENRT